MKRIVDLLCQQTISSDGAMDVGSFQRDNDVSEIQIFENTNMTHCRLNHRFGSRSAVLLQQIFLERTAVHADTDRHLLRLRCTHNLMNALLCTDVAWIEPQFVDTGFQ